MHQYIKLTISPDCSVELVGIHQLTLYVILKTHLIPRIHLQSNSIPSQLWHIKILCICTWQEFCHLILSDFIINACHVKYTLIYAANVEGALGIVMILTSKQSYNQSHIYSLPSASNSSYAIILYSTHSHMTRAALSFF